MKHTLFFIHYFLGGLFLSAFLLFTNINSLHAQWVQVPVSNGSTVYSFAVSGTNLFAGTYG
jgi:hypothetical protein